MGRKSKIENWLGFRSSPSRSWQCGWAQAQQTTQIPRIGFLYASESLARGRTRFHQELRKFGYIEGQNITVEFRFDMGQFERSPVLVAELLHLKVDVVVTRFYGNPCSQGGDQHDPYRHGSG